MILFWFEVSATVHVGKHSVKWISRVKVAPAGGIVFAFSASVLQDVRGRGVAYDLPRLAFKEVCELFFITGVALHCFVRCVSSL